MAALFLDLPPRADFPDYYVVIKQPIALNDIRVCSRPPHMQHAARRIN